MDLPADPAHHPVGDKVGQLCRPRWDRVLHPLGQAAAAGDEHVALEAAAPPVGGGWVGGRVRVSFLCFSILWWVLRRLEGSGCAEVE